MSPLVLTLACLLLGSAASAQAPPPLPSDRAATPRTAAGADSGREGWRIDLLALMSGRCRTLKVAGRDFACKAVAYAHSEKGRVSFAVALDDPADDSHVVSFSGENGKRADDNSYELPVDRMLLNSKDRPRVDGLPVPAEEISTGTCRQLGNFAARQVSSVNCSATDDKGRKYELVFESDGKPVSVRRVRESKPTNPFR